MKYTNRLLIPSIAAIVLLIAGLTQAQDYNRSHFAVHGKTNQFSNPNHHTYRGIKRIDNSRSNGKSYSESRHPSYGSRLKKHHTQITRTQGLKIYVSGSR